MTQKVGKARPFPWPCPDCREPTVYPKDGEYTARVRHGGFIHEVYMPSLVLLRCQKCGQEIITNEADAQIDKAFRRQLKSQGRQK